MSTEYEDIEYVNTQIRKAVLDTSTQETVDERIKKVLQRLVEEGYLASLENQVEGGMSEDS